MRGIIAMKKNVESAAATRTLFLASLVVGTVLEYLWVGAGAANTLYENMVRVGPNLRFGG